MMECDDALKARITENLSRLKVRPAENLGDHRYAAVALTVADESFGADLSGMPSFDTWQRRAALILTRRSSRLKDHPGQWAIPGGSLDDGETAEHTALRELREEVGLDLPTDAVIGRLDDFVTRSGFEFTGTVWESSVRRLLEETLDDLHASADISG